LSIETILQSPEFEQLLPHEVERKFIPVFPQEFEQFRAAAYPIEQVYLSHGDEPFSLRMREILQPDGNLHYEATLKSRGARSDEGIDRIEFPTVTISQQDYLRYKSHQTPIVRKLRSEPMEGIVVDFFEDGSVQLESENPTNWEEFSRQYGNRFVEVTGDAIGNSEWRAHLSFRRANDGQEALKPRPELNAKDIVADIIAQPADGMVTAHIAGRSGSGKSTIVREVYDALTERGIEPIILSTDDYHRGATWLTSYNNGEPWTEWDAPIVYDTAAMALDLAELRAKRPIWKRTIDFSDCEPRVDGVIQPTRVVIIEGIYASSHDIAHPGDLHYEMTTPLATCVGRRLLRDMHERPEFADPAKSLHYMLAQAEPAYRAQERVAK
jgi:uridine kinase